MMPDVSIPDVSIVVCTRNRPHAIVICLDAIAAAIQKATSASVEVVLVDNGSDDETGRVAGDWIRAHPRLRAVLVNEPRKGLSRARNAGVSAASGVWLAFTDDDCRLDPDYIGNLLAHAERDERPVLRGGRVLLGDPGDINFTTLDVSRRRVFAPASEKARPSEHIGGWILGCNMAIRRDAILKVGRFDERFGAGAQFKAGEDSDFIIRCHLAGISVEYVPDMLVHHHHGRRTQAQIDALLAAYDEGEGALYVKHFRRYPEFARQFWWDSRNAVREWFGGPLHIPELRHSHGKKIAANLRGMGSYWRSLLHNA